MTLNSIINFLSADLANAIAWTILHSLWQASLIALIMSFAIKKYGHRSSTIRYRISLSALYAVLLMAAGTFFYYYQVNNQLIFSGQLLSENTALVSNPSSSAEAGLLSNMLQFIDNNYGFIANTWLLGALFFALKFVGGITFLQKLKNTAILPDDHRLVSIFNELSYRLNIQKNINIAESEEIDTPMVMGFIKPLILVPAGIVNQLEYKEVEAILAHEIAHILRNDFLSNLAQSLVEVIFYYHPAVWWISANIRTERENCCDDMAVSICGNAIDYAKTLVKVQEWQVNNIPSLAIPLARNKQTLFDRISRILNQPQNRTQIREKLAATLLLCTALFAFASNPGALPDLEECNEIEIIHLDEEELGSEEIDLVLVSNYEQDSIPAKEEHETIIVKKQSNAKQVEIEIEDGEVKSLKVDGKEIPEDQYEEYESEFENYIDENGNKYFFLGDRNHMGFFGKDGEENPFFHLKELEHLNLDSLVPGKAFSDLLLFGDSLSFVFPKDGAHDYYFFADSIIGQFENQNWDELYKQYNKQLKDFPHHFQFDKDGENFFWKMDPKSLWVLPELRDSMFNHEFDFQEFHHNFDMDELRLKLKEFEGQNEFDFYFPENLERNEFKFHHKNPADVVLNELWEDGLLIEGKENKVELSGKHLKINGDKQPENIWRKYKKIYEEEAGHELTKKSKIELKVDGEKPRVRRRIIRI